MNLAYITNFTMLRLTKLDLFLLGLEVLYIS